jgi:diguanylate cyclase (GGDEF)-like protein
MGYYGRVMFISVIWITFILGLIYLHASNSIIHIKGILFAFLIYNLFGWWMGMRYDQLKFYSLRDVLTLTYNRRFVYKTFPKLRNQADRRNQKLVVYVIDVNDFKQVNDESGHAAGDLVLKNIAKSLNRLKKKGEVIARWGGDEFIMIASHTESAPHKLDSFIIEAELSELSKRLSLQVTVSVGKATYPNDAKSLDKLLKIADDNMYGLKHDMKDFVG